MSERRYADVRPTIATATAVRASKHTAPTIIGYASVFDREAVIGGYFREVIAPGAFSDAIRRDDVRVLFNHSAHWILGRSAAGTLRLSQDARGPRYEVDINADDPLAMSVVAKVKRGDISGSSFAFTVHPDDERWTYPSGSAQPLRTILRATLIDVSPVTFPAYQATTAYTEKQR